MTGITDISGAPLPLSIVLVGITARNDGAEMVLTMEIGNGEQTEKRQLTLLTGQYCELKPVKGRLTEEQFDLLEQAARHCGALRCGERLLSCAPNSERMLARKIMQRGFTREEAETAARELCDKGWINEEADLERETEKCLRKLWGERRIRAHLWSRGFAEETLRGVPELLREVDFPANCAQLIRKQFGSLPTDADALRRMTASLARYGYSLDEIRAAIRLLRRKNN